MEEWVGLKWHKFITRHSMPEYDRAAVKLEDTAFSLGILFRALGGPAGLRMLAATPRDYQRRRSWLKKLAGTGAQAELAWRDEESLRLPARIACFPEKALNEHLYVWLTALASEQTEPFANWFVGNQMLARQVLDKYPGIRSRYASLVQSYLSHRPDLEKMEPRDRIVEETLRRALVNPGSEPTLPPLFTAPEPVALWLYPYSVLLEDPSTLGDEDREETPVRKSSPKNRRQKKKAERVDSYDQNKGLMVFRLENLFSWSEFKPVDRAGDDTKEEDAESVADDLDVLSLSRDRKAGASAIRMDLDLPSAENDDLYLGDGILLPEWDYKSHSYREDYCCLQPMIADEAAAVDLPGRLKPQAQTLKRQFSHLKPERNWVRNLADGEELETDGWLEFLTDSKHQGSHSDQRIFRSKLQQGRALSCLILADLSLSTDAWVDNEHRVIDVIRDSLMLLSEALSVTGDRFAIYGFSSRKRNHVRYNIVKNFNEPYSANVRGRVDALQPGYYTRMGAAIRQSAKILAAEKAHQRVMLILSDGKPNDLDQYEGRYGIEDTRQAIIDARRMGLEPFCVTIDSEAEDYLPHLFGSNGYAVIREPTELSKQLPRLYVNLTR
jgi:nitric oxide reductase NorD protein